VVSKQGRELCATEFSRESLGRSLEACYASLVADGGKA
jgi:hypothetical protein